MNKKIIAPLVVSAISLLSGFLVLYLSLPAPTDNNDYEEEIIEYKKLKDEHAQIIESLNKKIEQLSKNKELNWMAIGNYKSDISKSEFVIASSDTQISLLEDKITQNKILDKRQRKKQLLRGSVYIFFISFILVVITFFSQRFYKKK